MIFVEVKKKSALHWKIYRQYFLHFQEWESQWIFPPKLFPKFGQIFIFLFLLFCAKSDEILFEPNLIVAVCQTCKLGFCINLGFCIIFGQFGLNPHFEYSNKSWEVETDWYFNPSRIFSSVLDKGPAIVETSGPWLHVLLRLWSLKAFKQFAKFGCL